MMGNGFGYGNFGMMGSGSLMMLLFLLVIGLIFYLMIKKQNPNKDAYTVSSQKTADSEGLNIAKERLARGEISIEEFEKIKKTLLLG